MTIEDIKKLRKADGSLPQLYLPSPPSMITSDNVEAYTLGILGILGLDQYKFIWYEASMELGHCSYMEHIAIHRELLDADLPARAGTSVWRVVLHEVAHALEMEIYGEGGHGQSWVHCCEALGLYGEMSSDKMLIPAPCPSAEFLLQTMLDSYYGTGR